MLALLVALVPARADAGSATLTAIADAYVNESTPTSNYGTRTAARIDGSPILNTYLKFDLGGVGGSITTATLSMYANSSNSAGFRVSTVADTSWDELAITYSRAPPIGTVVGSSGPVHAGTRIDVDVTAAVTAGAVVSLAMTETSSTAVSFGSRESATPPQLMVETDGATTTTSQTTTTGAPTTTTSQTTTSQTTTTSPSTDPVVAAAGDIACDPANGNFNGGLGTSNACRQLAVSNLMVGDPDLRAVLVLGDNQYYCGGYQAFLQSYDLSWGRLHSTTHPVVGNHEYLTSGGADCNAGNAGAAGYFTYFGAAAGTPGQGWYSFDVGAWHLIALNSNCSDAGGCGTGSPQETWLRNDLASHPNACVLAFYHIPLWSSGGRAANNTRTLVTDLYNANADVILTGHDHIYERFAPQNPNGVLDTTRGIREFVVGTGGANHTSIATVAPNSEVRNADTFGVLKLTLHPTGYDWRFTPEAGKAFTEVGSQSCH